MAQPTSLAVIGDGLCAEMFGHGFGFVGLILHMMQVVAPGKYQTAHCAFSTGIMQLGFSLFEYVSGDIQVALGYRHVFLWVLVAAMPVAVLSRVMPMRARRAPDPTTAPAGIEAS